MSNTPNRLTEVTDLVAALASCGKQIDRIRFDSEETNATLAMCEIAISFPPSWFTKEEAALVLAIVEVLYGDSKKFIDMIRSGHLSYYARQRRLRCASRTARWLPSRRSWSERTRHTLRSSARCAKVP
jgi:hypothetical protein